jgi:glycosyltransferase involved in cell wall biosynthesis
MRDLVPVSVIIPTACRPSRVPALRRAIASVLAQQGVDVEIIVVVNGPGYDATMLEELRANPALGVEYLPEPDLPAAHRHGRSLATAPFFSFLDDDDEYLPGSLRLRADVLLAEPDVDVVATQGVTGINGDQPYIRSADGVESDPFGALLRANWLGSCGALFRAERVTLDFFDGRTRYFEWTMVAFRLALAGRRIRYLETPTYRMHETEGSLSKSDAYYRAEPEFLASLEAYDLPQEHRRTLRRKYYGVLHSLAERFVRSGDMAAAWRYHLRSVAGRHGVKHVVYTRRMIGPSLRAGVRWLAARAGIGQQRRTVA